MYPHLKRTLYGTCRVKQGHHNKRICQQLPTHVYTKQVNVLKGDTRSTRLERKPTSTRVHRVLLLILGRQFVDKFQNINGSQ